MRSDLRRIVQPPLELDRQRQALPHPTARASGRSARVRLALRSASTARGSAPRRSWPLAASSGAVAGQAADRKASPPGWRPGRPGGRSGPSAASAGRCCRKRRRACDRRRRPRVRASAARRLLGRAAAAVAIGELGVGSARCCDRCTRSGALLPPPGGGAAVGRRRPSPSCRRRCGRFRAAGPRRRRTRWQCPPGPAAAARSAMSKRACLTISMSLRVPQGALPSTTSSAATPMRGSSRIDSVPRTAKSRPVAALHLGRQQRGQALRREGLVQRDSTAGPAAARCRPGRRAAAWASEVGTAVRHRGKWVAAQGPRVAMTMCARRMSAVIAWTAAGCDRPPLQGAPIERFTLQWRPSATPSPSRLGWCAGCPGCSCCATTRPPGGATTWPPGWC